MFHLSPKVLLGVHVGGGGKGVVEEDESVSVHVEGQVGTREKDVRLALPRFGRDIGVHVEKTQAIDIQGEKTGGMKTREKDYTKIRVKYLGRSGSSKMQLILLHPLDRLTHTHTHVSHLSLVPNLQFG